MFNQVLDPTGNLFVTWLVALVPVALLLFLLAVLRMSAWLAVLIGSIVTYAIAVWVWHMPTDSGALAYLYGSATGVWNVDWITIWGVMLFNTLVVTGVFEKFRRWLVAQGTADVRVQTMLFAWAFGALLEGLVGFGYPWAFVAPILITLGIPDLDAVRVAALANNAPVSYGALGAPIIGLAAVTGLPLMALSSSVGHIVAVLALLPPWVLLYLVSGRQGMWEAWPLAIVGSLAYIAGQLPVAVYLGPYLPDVSGSILCFVCLLALLKVWRPATVRGYGGAPLSGAAATRTGDDQHGLSGGEIFQAWLPIIVLVIIVVLWTGPWSKIPAYVPFRAAVTAGSALEPRQDRRRGLRLGAGGRRHRDRGLVAGDRDPAARQRRAARRDRAADLSADVGRAASSASSSSASPMSSTIRGWPRRSPRGSRRSACGTSSSRRCWAGSGSRYRAPTPRPTRCSARSSSPSASSSASRRCCCRP